MTTDSLGIVEARKKLGVLVSRAVHGHRPTRISRSEDERAVLISEEEYEELLRFRREREASQVREAMAAHERGELRMHRYESRDDLHADFGLPAPGDRS
ncbi:type II toxin-antitoxin system Phd/YefM family antitoxin [Nonomuraea sp. SYSU D8015]|uniref:type II toxin-antitoxin system Phd/YefM family antitoxin n=1 Tax=Nonomuraea sp. SYSU D8015 TaxID=2593644 RepID=UPI0016606EFB|nr:type II toxin-antitoxin system prevent-host-death family antitoxin [Nonomuraea sp. SYSU D8015]